MTDILLLGLISAAVSAGILAADPLAPMWDRMVDGFRRLGRLHRREGRRSQ